MGELLMLIERRKQIAEKRKALLASSPANERRAYPRTPGKFNDAVNRAYAVLRRHAGEANVQQAA